MNVHRVAISIVIFVVGLGITSLAFGQEDGKGAFVGVGIGQGSTDLSVSDFDDGSLTSGSVDDSDSGWKLFGGYNFNKNFGIEGGIVDTGKYTFSGVSAGGIIWAPGAVSSDVENQSIYVAVVGTIPFNKWAIFGKLGFQRWDNEVSITNTVFGSGSGDDDGTDPIYGLGFEFRPNERWGIRAEWEVFADALLELEDVNFLSVSGVYKFGQ